jgi:hypothetical protein
VEKQLRIARQPKLWFVIAIVSTFKELSTEKLRGVK